MLELRILGALELCGADGQELDPILRQPKRAALLAYLALAHGRGFHRRDTLLAIFWPELDEARSRNALNTALAYLRHGLGSDVVVSRGNEEVGLTSDLLWCDAAACEDALDEGQLADALALYRGDLLDGFHVSDAPGFEQWLESERARLRDRVAGAARALMERCATSGSVEDLAQAVSWARRAVALAPDDEGARRRLIERLVATGDHAGALRAYEDFASWLHAEFATEPAAATRALIEAVRSSATQEATAIAARRPSASQYTPPAPLPDGWATQTAALAHGSAEAAIRTIPTLETWRQPRSRLPALTRAVALLAVMSAAVSIGRTVLGRARPLHSTRQQLTFTGNAAMAAISPEGQFIAYVTQVGDSQRVLVQDVSGGAPIPIAVFLDVWTLEWSPDGTQLLIGSYDGAQQHGLATVLPRLGGQQRSLRAAKQFPPGVHAYWLPDGSRVSLHAWRDRRVLVVDLASEDSTAVPVEGEYTWLEEGSWSPDGRTFAVVTESSNPIGWAIRLVTLDGQTEMVVDDSVPLESPRWSPNGDALFYGRASTAIWRVGVATRTHRQRSKPEVVQREIDAIPVYFGHRSSALSVTSDGHRMVYARGVRYSNIWMIEAAESGQQPKSTALTTGTALRWGNAVSPDGRWIAFAQKEKGAAELFKMPIEGGAATQITFGARVRDPSEIAWSPDLTKIAFESVRAGRAHLWVASLESGQLHEYERTDMSIATGHLAWAPGSLIAYQRPDHRNVALVDPLSGDEHLLVAQGTPGFLFSPQYAPDGHKLAVARNRAPSAGTGVWVFDVRDSSSRQVTSRWLWPRGWSADGRYIYAQMYTGPTLFRLDARESGTPEPVLTSPFREVECTPAGPRWPRSFVCVAFEYVSDIWMLDNFDSDVP